MSKSNFAKKLYVRLYSDEADEFEKLKETFYKTMDSDMTKMLIMDFRKYYDKAQDLERKNSELMEQLDDLRDNLDTVKEAFRIINEL